jgi:CRP/FNR family transcriptional regulator, dissimilatory nitrate respiration regulator
MAGAMMKLSEFRPESFLEKVALFKELEPSEIRRIAAHTQRLELERGDILFRMGDQPQGFFLVIFGQVKLSFMSLRGDEKVVEVVGPGQTFGEAVMFVPRPYPVTAQALGDALLLRVSRQVVFEELDRDPKFAARIIAGLSRRIHGLMADLEANSMYSGVQRVIGFLLRDCGGSSDADLLELKLPTSKGVVASRLSITQEHFSRILHELTSHGLIEVDGRTIRVPSVARLQQYRP